MKESLKKLRIQFILTMMSIVTLFLVAIFSIQYISSKNEIKKNSENVLRIAMDDAYQNEWKPSSFSGRIRPENTSESSPDNKPDIDFDKESDVESDAENSPEFPGRMMDFVGNRNSRTPVLIVSIDKNDTATTVRNDMFFMEDDFISEIARETSVSSKEAYTPTDKKRPTNEKLRNIKSYRLSDYHLRYIFSNDGDTTYIAYVDESDGDSTLAGLLKRSLLISLGVFIVLLLLSILLAKRVLRPVEKSWEDQKRFVADASHELKTPLAVIMSNTDMIIHSDNHGDDRNSKRLENIKLESGRMKELVEELLDVARGDLDKKEIIKEDINLSELAEDELLVWEPVFFEAGKTLRTDISENINIKGDPSKIRKLISILVDNSLKYSDEKSTVTFSLKPKCRIEISNKGTPLSDEECHKIFERFYRADASREETSGYGLGLSIAETIVKEHGGLIKATSNGKDTNTFTVTLHN